MKMKCFGGLATGLLMVGMATTVFATPAWEFTSAGQSYSNGSWDFGNRFEVLTAVTVSGLGYYADPNNGFVDDNEVALYKIDGTLLASATVDNTYPLLGHFRYVTITPFVLDPGLYEIDGVSHGNNYTWNDPGFTTNSAIAYLGNTWKLSSTPDFQGNLKNDQTDGYWGPNLFLGESTFTEPVPEPTTMLLFGTGLAGLAAVRRRKKAC